jgi:hypothetical protein
LAKVIEVNRNIDIMKIKIATIIIGVLFVISMGYSSSSKVGDPNGLSLISIIKGTVINTDRDSHWEVVTFGIKGLDHQYDEVTLVEVFSKKGRLLGRFENPVPVFRQKESWYAINLDGFRLNNEFYLEIHVAKRMVIDYGDLSETIRTRNATDNPIDPEETILIVKYP